jgi:hypothetical protein
MQEQAEGGEERSASDEREAAVGDVGRELRRGPLEQQHDRIDDLRQRPL